MSDPSGYNPPTLSSPPEVFGDVLRMFSRHRRLMLSLPLLAAFALVAVGVWRPRTYTSAASFLGATGDMTGAGLANIASQFGLRLPARDATQSPQFYADLLRSRQLLDSVVRTEYTYRDIRGTPTKHNLVAMFGGRDGDSRVAIERAIAGIDRAIGVSVGRETGVARISVSTPAPELSGAIVSRFLELVNNFNLHTRQTRARAERQFAEARLREVEGELRQSEERLRAFLRVNRSYELSPTLTIEHDRLQRNVTTRQQVYITLLQAFEQARIDEVRDTPVITVVEPPYVPALPDRRGLLRRALLGCVLGTILAVGVAVLIEKAPHLRRRTRRLPA